MLPGKHAQIAVRPTMVTNLKQGIGHELHSPFQMRTQPLPTGSGTDMRSPEIVHNLRIVACHIVGPLTEVKRQGHDFAVLPWLDPTYGVLPGWRQRTELLLWHKTH